MSRAATVLATGVLAGTLDAAAASVMYFLRTGKSPSNVWRYVSSALLRADAPITPATRLACGLALHYAIALIWTLLFVVLASRVRWLRGHPLVVGSAYGLLMWTVMNMLVLPFTLIGPMRRFDPIEAVIGAGILVVCVGLPIVLGINGLRR